MCIRRKILIFFLIQKNEMARGNVTLHCSRCIGVYSWKKCLEERAQDHVPVSKLLFQTFFSIFFFIFFPTFIFQQFFFKIFVSKNVKKFFFSIFFQGLYHRRLLVYNDKTDSLCICVVKNMVCSKRSKLDFRLV